jgi:hypothetical protein
MSPSESPRPTVGHRRHYTERRVSGASPYGGEWGHGWKRQSAEKARARALKMVSRDGVAWARVQERVVDEEIVAEEILR